jgi:HSP20 family protein
MANQLMNRQQSSPAASAATPYLTLRDAMDRLFQDSFVWPRGFFSRDLFGAFSSQGVDLYETAEDVVVKAAVPGAKPEDVNIQIQGDELLIDAKLPEEKQENVTYHIRELTPGEYHRQVTLPVPIDTNKIEATFDNGIVTVRLPKAEQVRPKRIQIKAKGK